MRITIDRSLTTPVYLQIKGQIAYMIGLGMLPSGQRLPTIRRLASDIGVAPLTVVQALEALASEGLIETKPGVGSFVVDLHAEALARSRNETVLEIVTRSIEDANQHGISGAELATAMWSKVFPGRLAGQTGPTALFVGNYPDDTLLLANLMTDEFVSKRLVIHSRTIEELYTPTAETAALLETIDLIIAVPLRFAEVRRVIGDRTLIFGLPLTLSQSTREQLAHIPEAARLGLVVTEAEFMQSMRNIVAIYRPSSEFAPVAVMDEQQRVIDLLNSVDVVIYSMGIRERIRPLIPRNVLPIELTHTPDPAALAELGHVIDQIAAGEGEPATMVT